MTAHPSFLTYHVSDQTQFKLTQNSIHIHNTQYIKEDKRSSNLQFQIWLYQYTNQHHTNPKINEQKKL